MAKSKYPLMCATARGIFGRQLVYRETSGIPVVSIFRPPIDRKTPAQLASRQKFRDIASAWNSHTQEERDTLQPYVEGKNLTTYDYYTQQWIKTGEDPLGPPPALQNLMATTITNLFLPSPVGSPGITCNHIFISAPSITFLAHITDPTNDFIFHASAPEEELILFLVEIPVPEFVIPAGYIIIISTDIISDLSIYLPEISLIGQTALFPTTDGSTYYDPDLTMLAQAAP